MLKELITHLLNNRANFNSIYHSYRGINELYDFAKERCSFLMANSKYRKIILADHDLKIILAKGYLQGFYEALQVINDLDDQTKLKCS